MANGTSKEVCHANKPCWEKELCFLPHDIPAGPDGWLSMTADRPTLFHSHRKREGKKALRSPTVTLHLSLASRFCNWPGPSHTPSKWQENQDCHQKGCEKTSRAAELAGIATARRPWSSLAIGTQEQTHSTLHFLESNTKEILQKFEYSPLMERLPQCLD